MTPPLTTLGLDHLTRDQRLALVQELWDSIVAEGQRLASPPQRAELERRADEDDDRPNDVVPWEQVKARGRAGVKP